MILEECIDIVPGIRYGELLKLSGLSNGSLEYHLRLLASLNKIKIERDNGRRARDYPSKILENESRILGYLRNTASRQIILFIRENDLCTFREILKYINKAPSTLSWHLKRLLEVGIISIVKSVEHQRYRIENNELISHVLDKYRKSLNVT